MSKYASLVHGDEAEYTLITPRLRLRKYGSWLISERKKQAKIQKDRSRQLLAVVQLARKIAMEKGISIDQAFDSINSVDVNSNMPLAADYIEEVSDIVANSTSEVQNDAKILTIFLASRVEGFMNNDWVRLADWSEEDTDVLDEKTKAAIFRFIDEEQGGGSEVSNEDDEEEAEQGKESEGKAEKHSTSGKKSKSSASESSSTETTGTAATQESPLVA